jgi:hypothetical protein
VSTEPQSPFPTLGVSYAEVETSQTIRAATLARMAQACDVLASGRPARRAHINDAYPNGTSARTYVVSYTRTSDAIQFLYVAAHVSYGYHGDQLTLDLTIRDATGNTVSSSSTAIPAGFKVGNPWTAPPTFSADPQPADSYITTIASGYLDLDALAGTLSDPSWSIELAVASPVGTSLVVNLFEVFEMPRAIVDSADTYGLISGAVMPGRPLTSGSTSEDGIARLRQTLTGARLAQRTYVQECFGPDDTTAALVPRTTSATYAPLSELDEGGGAAVSWVFRVRTIVGGTGGETARARFRYLVSGGGTAYIRTTTGISTYDSAGLTSATWAWSDWIAVQLKANATGHLETVSFKGKTSAGTLYVSSWILEENVS